MIDINFYSDILKLYKQFDWILLGALTLIIGISLITIYSASLSLGLGPYYFYRQLTWTSFGLLIMMLVAFMDYRQFTRFALFLHLAVIVLLIATSMYGTGSNSSNVKRWLAIGPFFLQASEFAKFTVVLCIASYLGDARKFANINFMSLLWLSFLIIVPFVLIIKQPDLGTGLLFLITAMITIFFGGIRYRYIFIGFCLLLFMAPIVWQYGLANYQKLRVLALLQPNIDTLGRDYHITQSIIAIGSGGLFGKGYLSGSQAQLNFLPARHTDFIFALFAEEWGFIGALLLITLYLVLIFKSISSLGKSQFADENLLIIGMTSIYANHFLVNLAMVTQLLPVVGVPLPFFSYGGSSMISMLFGIGIIMSIKIRKNRQY